MSDALQCVFLDASARQPASGSAVVDVAIAHARDALIVDVGCGSEAHVGYRLLERGYLGRMMFVDWRSDSLCRHETCLRELAAHDDSKIPSTWRWECGSIYTMALDGAVLIVHGTLPRWTSDGQLVKPVGGAHGAQLLRELQTTGASVLVADVGDRDRETLTAGTHALGLRTSAEEGGT